MSHALRFVHASDLHLDSPFEGISEIPAHIRQALVEGPFAAAEKIFELAISERVDFVLLSGDIANVDTAGPRTIAFLIEQFDRLAHNGISVYWSGGSIDQPERWPHAISLPDRVKLFSSSMVEEVLHKNKSGIGIANIHGSGFDHRQRRFSEFRCEPDEPFPIALVYGGLESDELGKSNIRYWALGGNHQRSKTVKSDSYAVYPGAAQARLPNEFGAHGCTLVNVDTAGIITTQDVNTDSVRWHNETVTVSDDASREDIRLLLGDRGLAIASESSDQTVLVNWTIQAPGEQTLRLRHNGWIEDFTNWLRNEFGQTRPALWTMGIEVSSSRPLPEHIYEEDSLRGDFLRVLREYQNDQEKPVTLNSYFGDKLSEEIMLSAMQVNAHRRTDLLNEVTMLGVEKLSAAE